jgi:thiol-disulfide isomerase/thioredoxin
MKLAIQFATLLAFATCGATLSPARAAEAAAEEPAAAALKVGDAAPEFKVTNWIKGEAFTIDASKTYIIECWATWCGPCIAAFPHLSEVAKANKDKITVVGVNVWEKKSAEEVAKFVEGQGDKMGYNVAADGDQVIATKWLKAAGQNGIPCAFIVHKGKVTWIGHPNGLKQDLLDSILSDKFDVAAFAKEKEKQEAAGKYFSQNVSPLIGKKDFAGAIEKLEAMKKEFPDDAKIIDTHIERLKSQLPK